MTINELIRKVNAGTITIAEAVDVIEAENMTYAIKYFSPQNKGERPYWDLLKEWRIRQEAKTAPSRSTTPIPDSIPSKQGQLWEPCSCGREPIYMPLNLCARCWPTDK